VYKNIQDMCVEKNTSVFRTLLELVSHHEPYIFQCLNNYWMKFVLNLCH